MQETAVDAASGEPESGAAGARVAMRALIVLLTVLAYSSSLRAPFYFDDHRNIVNNPLVRDLGLYIHPWRLHEVAATGPQRSGFQTRFVAGLTFALNYRLNGTRVLGYHLFNLSIHLGSALLLFGIVFRTLNLPFFDHSRLRSQAEWVAAASAGLFALHPIQTQAVTYIVQRMASLAGFFCLLGLWGYLRARTAPAGGSLLRFLWPSLALAAAVLTKQNAVAFPAAVVLFELGFLPGRWGAKLRWLLAPLLAMLLAATVVLLPHLRAVAADPGSNPLLAFADVTRETAKIGRYDYLLTQTRVVATYLRLLVLPVGQNLDYDFPLSHKITDPGVVPASLLAVALCGLGVVLFRRGGNSIDGGWRLVGFGILWFYSLLSIESGLVPISDVIFEHRLYLPSVGFFVAVAAAAGLVPLARARRLAYTLLASLALAAAGATFARNILWSNELAFWRDVAAKSPNKARVQYNLGFLLRLERRDAEAEAQFRRVVELDPHHRSALVNLGHLARQRGDLAAAADDYVRASQAAPEDWSVLLDLRTVRLAQNRPDEAARLWTEAVKRAGSEEKVRQALERAGAASLIPDGP